MYLTQVSAIKGDDYQQHQVVRKIFPGDQKVLFQKSDNGLTVLSSAKPIGLQSQELDIFSLAVIGKQFNFTIRLNPVKRDMKTHKRVTLDNDFVKPWITRQFIKAGVEAKFQYIKEGTRRSLKQGKIISFASVICFGLLTVKDVENFQKALEQGIGCGKGFGFGLLNIFAYL
jgi:CRISPR-associated protein Cas6/Cse3/CasE subtype I-E